MSPAVLPLQLRDPLRRRDLPGLYSLVSSALARQPVAVLEVEVRELTADAVAVDALARLALAARRNGCAIALQGARNELLELLELAGLSELIG